LAESKYLESRQLWKGEVLMLEYTEQFGPLLIMMMVMGVITGDKKRNKSEGIITIPHE
jgi:hypothetical protein